jgi:hypothetical protein
MFLKSSFSLPQSSGFVAFDGGGTAEPDVRRETVTAPAIVVVPRLEPELLRAAKPAVEAADVWQETPTWQPATGRMVRRVEAALLVAICGYFALGFAGLVGWF